MTTEQRNQWRGSESSPITFTAVRPHSSQANTGYDEQLDDDTLYPTRQPSSAKRYQSNGVPPPQQHAVMRSGQQQLRRPDQYDNVNVYVRRRTHAQGQVKRQQQAPPSQAPRPVCQREPAQDEEAETEPLRAHRQRAHTPRFHWVWYLGLGMIAMLILWIVGASALTWWQGYQDDLRYGHPRTYQTDARVGHNDATTPSHFIVLDLNHRVEVVEFPGGDATQAKVYLGPTLIGPQSDLDIVSVSFKDVNGDGKLDLILSVDTAKYIYINDNGAFRTLHADEHTNM